MHRVTAIVGDGCPLSTLAQIVNLLYRRRGDGGFEATAGPAD